jgi:hypothetical protein
MDDQKRVKTILDRVLTWPPERQEDAAHMLNSWKSRIRAT